MSYWANIEEDMARKAQEARGDDAQSTPPDDEVVEVVEELRRQHGEVFEQDLMSPRGQAAFRKALRAVVDARSDRYTRIQRDHLFKAVWSLVQGYGRVQFLAEDDTVSEIMGVPLPTGEEGVWVERAGRLHRTDLVLTDEEAHLLAVKIAARAKRQLNRADTPMVDAELLDGNRGFVVREPVLPSGVGRFAFNIRRFQQEFLSGEALIRAGTVSPEAWTLTVTLLRGGVNVLIGGPTGTGKSTYLAAGLGEALNRRPELLPPGIEYEGPRVVSIEDTSELQLWRVYPHVVPLVATKRDEDDKAEGVPYRQIVPRVMRMRPDLVVPGEIRGPEYAAILVLMSSGHQVVSTVHTDAAEPEAVEDRLIDIRESAGVTVPREELRREFRARFSALVLLDRFPDGSRRVVRIVEVSLDGCRDLFVREAAIEGKTVRMGELVQKGPLSERLRRRIAYRRWVEVPAAFGGVPDKWS